jgi:hypothetical protein
MRLFSSRLATYIAASALSSICATVSTRLGKVEIPIRMPSGKSCAPMEKPRPATYGNCCASERACARATGCRSCPARRRIARDAARARVERVTDTPESKATSIMSRAAELDILCVTPVARPSRRRSSDDGRPRGALFPMTGPGVRHIAARPSGRGQPPATTIPKEPQ